MFYNALKLVLAILCVSCVSCKDNTNKSLEIKFSADSSAILIANIESAALLQLKNNLKTDTMYQKLVSVLETPGEDDSLSMEREWPGKLIMEGDHVVFKPDSAFLKGKTYLVEALIGMQFASVTDVVRSDVGRQLKKQQKVLVR